MKYNKQLYKVAMIVWLLISIGVAVMAAARIFLGDGS